MPVRLAVVIPVKSFTVAKGRLADVLSPADREVLARQCADTVVKAAARLFCGTVSPGASTKTSYA